MSNPRTSLGSSRTARRRIALGLWLAVLAGLTLVPQPVDRSDPHLQRLSFCIVCGDRGASDAILNAVLFVPLGLLLDPRRWKPGGVLAVGVLLSLSIESIQHFVPGRYSNLGDVLSNASGAWLGAILLSHAGGWLPPTARRGGRLANAAMLVPTLATLAFGWLMEPDWPREPYYGQWTPELGSMEQYDGTVVRARLDTLSVPPGRFPPRDHPRQLLQGDWELRVVAVKGDPPSAISPIVSIYNAEEEEVLVLGAFGEDLLYREGSRAHLLRLDQPDMRLRGAIAGAAVGDTMDLRVRRHGGARCLSFGAGEACPAFTPGRAWSLLMYTEGLGDGPGRLVDGLWLLLLFVPVGLWSDTGRGLAVRGLMSLLGVGLAVSVTRLGAAPWTEVVAAGAGLLVGHGLRRVLGTLRAEARDPGPA